MRDHARATAPPSEVRLRGRRVLRESDLEWFWSDGQSVFESSSFGAVVERQAHFGQRAQQCAKCEGTGIVPSDGSWCRSCKGFGSKPERLSMKGCVRPGGLVLGTRRCGHCHGRTGIMECRFCHGAGAIETSPVGLASAYDETPSYMPNEADLTRYAQVSRWLLLVPAISVRVMRDYYGLEGYRWGGTKWGRIMAVVPHTAAGQKLLRRIENPQRLSEHALLANELDRIDRVTDIEKRQAARARIAVATHQAKRLFAETCEAWNAVVDASRSRRRP